MPNKKKPKAKPLTAQPIGYPFAVNTSNSLKPLRKNSSGYATGPSGNIQYGDGCYRKMPTCKD